MMQKPPPHDVRPAALVAFAALVLIMLWLPLTVRWNHGGNWSGLFCTGSLLRQPPDLAGGTRLFRNSYGYDGQFYRYVAHDPFFQKGYAQYIDNPRFRYRRGLVPLTAWALAGGRPRFIDAAFIAVVLASVAAGVYWSARYLALRGRHPAWGLIFLLLPSTITSVDRMLTDATLAALFAGFVFYAASHRWRAAWTVSALAVLTRETGLLLVAALAAYWIWQRRPKRAVAAAAAVLPALAWYGFVAVHTAGAAIPGVVALPFAGWLAGIAQARTDPTPWVRTVLQAASLVGMAGLAGSVFLAARWAWKRLPEPAAVAVLLFAAMSLVLGGSIMCDPYAYGRALSPLLLFLMLEAAARGSFAALVPALGVSAAVGVMMGAQLVVVAKGVLGL